MDTVSVVDDPKIGDKSEDPPVTPQKKVKRVKHRKEKSSSKKDGKPKESKKDKTKKTKSTRGSRSFSQSEGQKSKPKKTKKSKVSKAMKLPTITEVQAATAPSFSSTFPVSTLPRDEDVKDLIFAEPPAKSNEDILPPISPLTPVSLASPPNPNFSSQVYCPIVPRSAQSMGEPTSMGEFSVHSKSHSTKSKGNSSILLKKGGVSGCMVFMIIFAIVVSISVGGLCAYMLISNDGAVSTGTVLAVGDNNVAYLQNITSGVSDDADEVTLAVGTLSSNNMWFSNYVTGGKGMAVSIDMLDVAASDVFTAANNMYKSYLAEIASVNSSEVTLMSSDSFQDTATFVMSGYENAEAIVDGIKLGFADADNTNGSISFSSSEGIIMNHDLTMRAGKSVLFADGDNAQEATVNGSISVTDNVFVLAVDDDESSYSRFEFHSTAEESSTATLLASLEHIDSSDEADVIDGMSAYLDIAKGALGMPVVYIPADDKYDDDSGMKNEIIKQLGGSCRTGDVFVLVKEDDETGEVNATFTFSLAMCITWNVSESSSSDFLDMVDIVSLSIMHVFTDSSGQTPALLFNRDNI
ncbi:hypothetical protein ADUPG1_010721 [Aduncisulcus paluster]|uniref:Uncharacterized protein n=2 Tax=Aduncisulcus paluster TaxID=2918883 RepID=A0ABQ5JVD2_9EUKA|nr:hypothetical protein ADUPG1_010721 [Aduncisulcus paluster]|eukprot:gnl/Carplike_NY0171/767_a1056_1009.p1 GENE.gnl/Carplike_NY0171/767_a1056_1009~~gnl/Carplike_NY0171/767_a1056_1009.p1  ORF type:complete len:580 (+),score=184.02 gnl/Carplike_NY0171/767_a1056_1009:43-1782(+)